MKNKKEQELLTTKVTQKSLNFVRILSPILGEKQYEIIERLLREELTKVFGEEPKCLK